MTILDAASVALGVFTLLVLLCHWVPRIWRVTR